MHCIKNRLMVSRVRLKWFEEKRKPLKNILWLMLAERKHVTIAFPSTNLSIHTHFLLIIHIKGEFKTTCMHNHYMLLAVYVLPFSMTIMVKASST